jgi:polysaccharide export outer membrane protein
VHTAPELSRIVRVDPEGFITLPGIAPVTAAARPVSAVQADLEFALSGELINPRTDVLITGLAARSIFVSGHVRSPGLFELPGDIDPVQAILMAGGFTNAAFAQEILIIRKLPEGEIAAELIDLRRGARDPSLAAWLPLQRFDILYVPDRRMTEPGPFARRLLREEAPPPFLSFYGISAASS